MSKNPVFFSNGGSTQDPGVEETIFMGRSVSAYKVITVPANRVFVVTHVSASVTRGGTAYPAANLNDYGAIGYVDAHSKDNSHFLPFIRSEPNGFLLASQSVELYVPAGATVVVKVPLISGQSGGASVQVSGYYLVD